MNICALIRSKLLLLLGGVKLKDFFKQIDKAILGSLSVFLFFVLGFIWWIFDADTYIPIWILFVVIILCYLICIIIYAFGTAKEVTTVYRLPIVKNIIRVNEKCIFIVEKNELFSQGAYATICYQNKDSNLEIVLGLGYVQSINSSGCAQIETMRVLNDPQVIEIYQKIKNTSFDRKSIKIKPSVYKELFEEAL